MVCWWFEKLICYRWQTDFVPNINLDGNRRKGIGKCTNQTESVSHFHLIFINGTITVYFWTVVRTTNGSDANVKAPERILSIQFVVLVWIQPVHFRLNMVELKWLPSYQRAIGCGRVFLDLYPVDLIWKIIKFFSMNLQLFGYFQPKGFSVTGQDLVKLI